MAGGTQMNQRQQLVSHGQLCGNNQILCGNVASTFNTKSVNVPRGTLSK
jgi:hypothetical protein